MSNTIQNLPSNTDIIIDVNGNSGIKTYVIFGGASLSTDVSIVLSGTVYENDAVKLLYFGRDTETNGNTLEILGKDVTQFAQANMEFTAFYKDSQWEVAVASDFNAVNIPDKSITNGKLSDDLNIYPLTLQLDTTGTLKDATRRIRIPHAHELVSFSYNVLVPMVDDGLLLRLESKGNLIHSITIPTTATAGNTSVVSSLDNSIRSSTADYLDVISAKTTSGGSIFLTFMIKRI